jgi:hypothetical protein
MLTKRCTYCHEEKDESEFYTTGQLRLNGTKIRSSQCKKCKNKIQWKNNKEKCKLKNRNFTKTDTYKKWVAEYKRSGKQREVQERFDNGALGRFRRSLYQSWNCGKRGGYLGCTATPEQLEAAFIGKCSICGRLESDFNKGLHMDHCHKTGRFRGFICCRCNRVLGYMNDSPELLRKAATYLE